MVGASEVVSESLGTAAAHEYRTGVTDTSEPVEGVVHAELKVLGSDLVGDIYDDVEVIGDDDLAVAVDGGSSYLGTLEHGYLLLELL